MFGYNNPKCVTVTLSDPTKDNTYHILRVPSRTDKIEILEAWAVSDTTVTLGDGTGVALRLYDYGTAGSSASGTVSASLGGTTVTWTAGTPKAFTISEGTMEDSHYLVVGYDETGTIAPLNITVGVIYVDGVGA